MANTLQDVLNYYEDPFNTYVNNNTDKLSYVPIVPGIPIKGRRSIANDITQINQNNASSQSTDNSGASPLPNTRFADPHSFHTWDSPSGSTMQGSAAQQIEQHMKQQEFKKIYPSLIEKGIENKVDPKLLWDAIKNDIPSFKSLIEGFI